ncbi:transcription factor bHLH111 isoform X2 [Rhodamnia argentea]|uniref:Transcription factor bHLH111 isoform X2 n=1 Tax=Rhodamnia argentea TaxID=178133 RepID=A0A8B8MQB5_9MYRT|nr:transcription factor bHLH111 isoform X2 [Rhodamnia argentea]
MAEECAESSVAIAAAGTVQPGSWWQDPHGSSISPPPPPAWIHGSNHNPWGHHNQNPSSNDSPCDEAVSISSSAYTNTSIHSGLTVESSGRFLESTSSPNELIGEHLSDHHLWNHVLLVGSGGDLHSHQHEVPENLLDSLSSKTMSNLNSFEPPSATSSCSNYLKKSGNTYNIWDFPNTSLNGSTFMQGQRFSSNHKLSTSVGDWSIAPPDPEVNLPFGSSPMSLSSSSTCHGLCGSTILRPQYSGELEASVGTALFRRSPSVYSSNNVLGDGFGPTNASITADNGRYYGGAAGSSSRGFDDDDTSSSFSSRIGRRFKTLNLSDCKIKPVSSPPVRANMRGQGNTSEGKKKRSEDGSETVAKKPKHESAAVSSSKMQVTKVKLGDRITALQQIVSPFGKTDTASVLMEAIGYIKFLQEQVRLLVSNPYLKTNPHKDPWGALDRIEKGDFRVDLKTRGLCLVPVSCTPQVYRDNTGSDYWTPPYRGVLYR